MFPGITMFEPWSFPVLLGASGAGVVLASLSVLAPVPASLAWGSGVGAEAVVAGTGGGGGGGGGGGVSSPPAPACIETEHPIGCEESAVTRRLTQGNHRIIMFLQHDGRTESPNSLGFACPKIQSELSQPGKPGKRTTLDVRRSRRAG
jgi:hypothetical protein